MQLTSVGAQILVLARRLPLSALLALLALNAGIARAQAADPADLVCPRAAPGSTLTPPPELHSQNGTLELTLQLKSVLDAQGTTRYCYVTDTGLHSPVLHVLPGDELLIHFQNTLPPTALAAARPAHVHAALPGTDCGGGAMSADNSNLHFHGMNVAPVCHQDEVLSTLIPAGGTFDYTVQIPGDEPTGLYWYHPHPHGFSNGQAQGGAAGALVVDGIENVVPAVAGLPQRFLVLRDQRRVGDPAGPTLDVSVNDTPVTYPDYTPAVLPVPPGAAELWRVLNASSNTSFALEYQVAGSAQALQVVAIDGVPVGQGTSGVQSTTQTRIDLPPGARAEFILTTPTLGQAAALVTLPIDTGAGFVEPGRPLLNVLAQAGAVARAARLPPLRTSVRTTRFARLSSAPADARRSLYFSEQLQGAGAGFFITVVGQAPAAFDMSGPPAIVLHQGATEEWTIENRTGEDHAFHIHQVRFQVLAANGVAVSDPALHDTITVPHWSGSGPYPSVTLRLDFRASNIVGTFVYHCHLLSHEDAGMMGAIKVLAVGSASHTTLTASSGEVIANGPFTLSAAVSGTQGTPSGSVQFFDGTTALGAPVPLTNGQAQLTATLGSYGTHALSAAYSGDASYNQSLSDTQSLAVEDFALSAGTMTVTAGGSASTQVSVTTSPSFASRVDLSCQVPAALQGATCTLNPASITSAGPVQLTLSTAMLAQAGAGGRWLASAPAGGMLLAGWLLVTAPRRSRHARRLLLLLGAVLLSSCAGSGSPHTGIPPGNYTLTVSGVCGSSITHALAVTVQVVH